MEGGAEYTHGLARPPRMIEALDSLTAESYDLLVIGGGATGAGVAWDAALRGYRVALVERGDFAGATSSASTKLVHGGVRYLEKAARSLDLGQLRLVIGALRERAWMLASAPHLTRRLELVIPLQTRFQRWYFGFGLALYDRLAGRRSLGRTRGLAREELLAGSPGLAKDASLRGGVLYVDGAFDDARFALELVRSAEARGARARNWTEVLGFEREGARVVGARVRDRLDGSESVLRARHTICCAGPFADALRTAIRPGIAPRIRASQGIHVVLEASWWPGERGLLVPRTPDGRVLFALPWEGRVLVGTTDTEVVDTSRPPRVRTEDIAYVLETFGRAIGRAVPPASVLASWAGYRPLVASGKGGATEALIRDHEVEVWPEEGVLHVLGGKWTTFRAMAEDAVDRLAPLRGEPARPCRTASSRLVDAKAPDEVLAQPELTRLPADVATRLVRYGVRAGEVARRGDERLLPHFPYTLGEVAHAIEVEHARTSGDVLDRRLRLGQIDERARAEALAVLRERHPLLPPEPQLRDP